MNLSGYIPCGLCRGHVTQGAIPRSLAAGRRFIEAEATAAANIPEPELRQVQRHYRKSRHLVNDRLPENLQIEAVEHDLPIEKQVCPECGGPLHVMGREKRRELKVIPAKVVIVKHIRKVYACRDCERDEYGVPIVKAPVDEPVIKGSFALPESIVYIMTQKFVMGAPVCRQEQDWARRGIPLSRQTMSNWLLKATEDWLEPIYETLREILCMRRVLHTDEAILQVLHKVEKAPQSTRYVWLYRTGSDAQHPIVLCDYQPERRAKRPVEFLADVKGICTPMATTDTTACLAASSLWAVLPMPAENGTRR